MQKGLETDTGKSRGVIFLSLLLCLILGLFLFLCVKNNLRINSELEEKDNEINQLETEINQLETEINQLDTELTAATEYWNITLRDLNIRRSNISKCVEPFIPIIRDIAVAQVANSPPGIESDNDTWKIWQINYWVSQNISYVSDPNDFDYYALASETMLIRAGDCDDIAILTASMYEAVGIDTCIISLDTDNDTKVDHMACAVYYSRSDESFIEEEKEIMEILRLKSESGDVQVTSYEAASWEPLLKYDSGIWIVIDPKVAQIPGYLNSDKYNIIRVIDVGGLLPYFLPD